MKSINTLLCECGCELEVDTDDYDNECSKTGVSKITQIIVCDDCQSKHTVSVEYIEEDMHYQCALLKD